MLTLGQQQKQECRPACIRLHRGLARAPRRVTGRHAVQPVSVDASAGRLGVTLQCLHRHPSTVCATTPLWHVSGLALRVAAASLATHNAVVARRLSSDPGSEVDKARWSWRRAPGHRRFLTASVVSSSLHAVVVTAWLPTPSLSNVPLHLTSHALHPVRDGHHGRRRDHHRHQPLRQGRQ